MSSFGSGEPGWLGLWILARLRADALMSANIDREGQTRSAGVP